MQGLQNQYNTGLAQFGSNGPASQGAQGIHATSVISNQQLQQQIGQADAQAGLTKAGMWSNFWGGLAGAKAGGIASSAWGGFNMSILDYGQIWAQYMHQTQCKALCRVQARPKA